MPGLDWTELDIFLVSERAHGLHSQGRYQEAAVLFAGLLALDPGNAYCREGLAAAYLGLGRHAEAIHELTHVLEQDSTNSSARIRRSEAYLIAGRMDEASRDVQALQAGAAPNLLKRIVLRMGASARLLPPAR